MGALERLQQLGLASGLSQKEVNPDVTPRRNQGSFSTPTNHRFTNITSPSGGGLGAVDSSGVLSALQEKADIQRKLATDPRLRSLNPRMALASAMRGEDAFQKYAVQPRLAAADADLAVAEKKKLMGFGNNAFSGFGQDAAYLSQLYKADPKAAINLANKIREKQATSQAKNLELTNTEKNLAAAGIDPASAQGIAAILGDNDLTTYEKKQQIQQKFNLESKAIDQLFTAGQAETAFQRDLIKQLQKGEIEKEKFLLQYGPGGKEAFEARKEDRKLAGEFYKDVVKKAEGYAEVAPRSSTILDFVVANPDKNFTKPEKYIADAKTFFNVNNAGDISVQQVSALISQQTLPLAKTLGANPSNRDVITIRESKGENTNRYTLAYNTAMTLADKEIYEDYAKAMGEAHNDLEAQKKIKEDFLANYNDLIQNKTREVLQSKGGNDIIKWLDDNDTSKNREEKEASGSSQPLSFTPSETQQNLLNKWS